MSGDDAHNCWLQAWRLQTAECRDWQSASVERDYYRFRCLHEIKRMQICVRERDFLHLRAICFEYENARASAPK